MSTAEVRWRSGGTTDGLLDAAGAGAIAVAGVVLGQTADGHLSLAALDHPDGTTLLMLWGLVWLLTGFPQLDGRVVHSPVVPRGIGRDQVCLLDRGTEAALLLACATLLTPVRPGSRPIVDSAPRRPGRR